MLVKEIKNILGDRITVYKDRDIEEGTYEDVYSGDVKNIPLDVLLMTIRVIGAKRKGVLDIWVE